VSYGFSSTLRPTRNLGLWCAVEGRSLVTYTHWHRQLPPITARIYTDLSLFQPATRSLGRRCETKVFNTCQATPQADTLGQSCDIAHHVAETAPAGHDRAAEAEYAQRVNGEIWAKMNSVVDAD